MYTKLDTFFYTNQKHLWLDFILHLNLLVNDLAIYSAWGFCTHKQVKWNQGTPQCVAWVHVASYRIMG